MRTYHCTSQSALGCASPKGDPECYASSLPRQAVGSSLQRSLLETAQRCAVRSTSIACRLQIGTRKRLQGCFHRSCKEASALTYYVLHRRMPAVQTHQRCERISDRSLPEQSSRGRVRSLAGEAPQHDAMRPAPPRSNDLHHTCSATIVFTHAQAMPDCHSASSSICARGHHNNRGSRSTTLCRLIIRQHYAHRKQHGRPAKS